MFDHRVFYIRTMVTLKARLRHSRDYALWHIISCCVLFPWLPAVDDGSGVLSCCQWRRSEDSEEGLYLPSIGQLVSVFGRVEEFRGERQLRISAIGKTCEAVGCVLNCRRHKLWVRQSCMASSTIHHSLA